MWKLEMCKCSNVQIVEIGNWKCGNWKLEIGNVQIENVQQIGIQYSIQFIATYRF